jgi:hypothetical protein
MQNAGEFQYRQSAVRIDNDPGPAPTYNLRARATLDFKKRPPLFQRHALKQFFENSSSVSPWELRGVHAT